MDLATEHGDADREPAVQALDERIAERQPYSLLPQDGAANGVGPGWTNITALVTEVPLTEPQLEIMLAAQVSDDANCAFNESFRLSLEGALDVESLRLAWQSLVDRHDALRMSLVPAGDRMRVHPGRLIAMQEVDLSGHSANAQQDLLDTVIVAEGKQPFDLVQGPLVRLQLVKLAAQKHLLVITAHHLICDGWTASVLVDELGKMYSAALHHGSPELSSVLSFSQYALDVQRPQWREQERNDLAYWKQQLTPEPELLALPSDRSRPTVRSFEGSTYVTEFPKAFVAALRKTGAQSGCTLFTTLLAGWQILLWRLSGNPDPVTLIPSAAQSLMDGRVLVGHCVHLLPIRAALAPEMVAADYMRALKPAVLDAYEHQHATYGSIVRALAPRREPGRLPLSEIQFNLEQVDRCASFEGIETEVQAHGKLAVNFDLFLNIVDTGNGLRLECDYSTGLYDESTIACWLRCYRTLLESMVSNPTQSVAKLEILGPDLRTYLLETCNATATATNAAENVPELIRAAFTAMPEQPAADFYGMELTRPQLAERSDRLAAWLMRHGAWPGALVGIYMDRSLDMLVAMLGVMKAGAAYVPLDPMFPPARIAQIVEETNVPVMITLSEHLDALPKSQAKVIALDAEADALAAEPIVALPNIPSDARVYVIFTSGSTGRPKGVEVCHGSVVNLLADTAQRLEMKPQDRLLAVTTLSFDIAVLEMLLPLVSGGTVVIARGGDVADGAQLVELLQATRATVLQATPATWRMLIEQGFQPSSGFKMLCGGEAWTPAMADQLLAGGGRLWNMYGPTETTVWSSITEVKRGATRMTLGPPIANTRFYVLDAGLQLVPPGVSGELLIAGGGVARGYFNRPELTAEKFLLDPFKPGERMYRTGDEVRQLPDGRIEFLGRLDRQIKLRGFRIELGDVETALRALPGVRDAVAVLRPDASGEAILVGYYTGGENSTPAELKRALGSQLPAYMIPTILTQLDKLPLTPNGKIDRRALPEPCAGVEVEKAEFIEPGTRTETILAKIFCEVLGCSRISIRTSLLDQGADSLRMFQIASRAHRRGFAVSAKQLMQLHTVEAVAAAIDMAEGNARSLSDCAVALQRASREDYEGPRIAGSGIETTEMKEDSRGPERISATELQESPPLSPSERDMLRIWRQVLKIEDLDMESNFFDLGGHSLLLARLQIAMKREFNVQLTAAEVFRQPTIGTLAAWLEQARSTTPAAKPSSSRPWEQNPRIVPIQPLGADRPVFVISQSMIFRTFAAELGTDQPVYAIQMLDQDTVALDGAGFGQLIEFYTRLIRTVQPSGPYRLAGWCVSGWIAYGVARQLEQQGEEIEMVMIIDVWAPAYWSGQPPMRRCLMLAIYWLQRFRWMEHRLRHRSLPQSGPYIRRSFQGFAKVAKELTERFQRVLVPLDVGQREKERRRRRVEGTAVLASEVGPLLGRALFFRSEEEPTGSPLPADMGWSQLTGRQVHMEMLPGNHLEILGQPGAGKMAARVRELFGLATVPKTRADMRDGTQFENWFAKNASTR